MAPGFRFPGEEGMVGFTMAGDFSLNCLDMGRSGNTGCTGAGVSY